MEELGRNAVARAGPVESMDLSVNQEHELIYRSMGGWGVNGGLELGCVRGCCCYLEPKYHGDEP